jgi:hypothetical protein
LVVSALTKEVEDTITIYITNLNGRGDDGK